MAPGSIASVFGVFPAGVSFRLDSGVPVQVYSASATQANIQIPWELATRAQASLVAVAGGQTSAPEPLDLVAYAPGIFTVAQDGSGQGAILDTSYRLVDPANPAHAGETYISIFCTGLGEVILPPPGESLSRTRALPAVRIGGEPARVLFSGLAPGYPGLYQVNALVPRHSAAGDAVPVTVSLGGYTSNAVTIAVRPPPAEMDPDLRASRMLARMTQDEKVHLIHGHGGPVTAIPPLPRGAGGYIPPLPRLGIPALYFSDGSTGVANSQAPSTALPSALASAAAWDLPLAYEYGRVIGADMAAHGLNVNLGGNVNLGREPRNGRTFETKGEDPILAGRINAAHVRAIQDQHILGGIKHFALNDQETNRTALNVVIGEREARQTDLLAFEIGIKDARAQSVMCSYNKLGGEYACENPHLLTDILKLDWGFPGFVMSDWWGTHSTDAAALSGLDQEQPDSANFATMAQAVAAGRVPQSRLDDMVRRILRSMYAVGLFDVPNTVTAVDVAGGEAVAQRVAEEGAVLLKNERALLPLDVNTTGTIAVIGPHADIGVLSGGGSAQVYPIGGPALNEGTPCPPCWAPVIWNPSSPLQAVRSLASRANIVFDDGGNATRAAALARTADVVLLFPSVWTSEGMDLTSLSFASTLNATIAAVTAANPRTVVVLQSGGALLLPWLNEAPAVLAAWYPGARGAQAIARLLFGHVNPSGKLPVTFPASLAELPHPTIQPAEVDYYEGLLVGYKWYDANNLSPRFAFGFGLSYTTFALANAQVSAGERVKVTFDLANSGAVAGAEVAQVYVGFPAGLGEPPRRLVGWQKVFLQPGARQRVTIEIDPDDAAHPLSIWTPGGWITPAGDYEIWLGTSSRRSDLTKIGTVRLGN